MIRTRPQVSVLMPVRDGGAHLRTAVDSILCQSLDDIELVLVDDGSRDDAITGLDAIDDDRLQRFTNPGQGIVSALKLAAMRGVDVRIMIPGLADKWFIKLAAMSYVEQVTQVGVKMYEFGPGFLHQKVVLIDDTVSVIGTANFDNRSFRLNFEISVITIDREFAVEVQEMLQRDFSTSSPLTPEDVAKRPIVYRVGSRVAKLFAPVL